MNRWRTWLRDAPLSTRTVAIMLLLLLLVQAVAFGIVRATVNAQVRNEMSADLLVGERVWLRLLEQNAERLRQAYLHCKHRGQDACFVRSFAKFFT